MFVSKISRGRMHFWNAVRLLRRIIVLLFTWGLQVDLSSFSRVEWSLAVKWVTEGIDNTSEDFWTDWNIDDSTGSLDGITFFDESIVTENDNTNIVSFQVQGLIIVYICIHFLYHVFNYILLTIPLTPEENSTISSAWMFLRPWTRAIPSPIAKT